MFTKLKRTKVFRDPLYGYINVDYKIISDLIDSRELQRLRRITQLSGVSMVFPTAEHSRFTHSLGAYQMANLVIAGVDGFDKVSEYEKLLFLIAALLHDVGHGPFSHAFECVMEKSHEDMGIEIILNKNTEINKILAIGENLASDVACIIKHSGKYPLIEELVSSQLDVDRMDYLSRDAYFTGAPYGTLDYLRIIRSMKIVDNKILVKASGIYSIESYLMSRYHMYFQVYFHPTARAYECILEAIYARIKDLVLDGKKIDADVEAFMNVLKDNNDIESYLILDDSYIWGLIKQLGKSNDKVLRQMTKAIEGRHLFKCLELSNAKEDEVASLKEKYKDNEFKKYYYRETKVSQVAYLHVENSDIFEIKVLLPDGRIERLDNYSSIINSLVKSSYKEVERIYYFED